MLSEGKQHQKATHCTILFTNILKKTKLQDGQPVIGCQGLTEGGEGDSEAMPSGAGHMGWTHGSVSCVGGETFTELCCQTRSLCYMIIKTYHLPTSRLPISAHGKLQAEEATSSQGSLYRSLVHGPSPPRLFLTLLASHCSMHFLLHVLPFGVIICPCDLSLTMCAQEGRTWASSLHLGLPWLCRAADLREPGLQGA